MRLLHIPTATEWEWPDHLCTFDPELPGIIYAQILSGDLIYLQRVSNIHHDRLTTDIVETTRVGPSRVGRSYIMAWDHPSTFVEIEGNSE